MAKYITIDADAHGLLAVYGSATRDRVNVERLVAATDLAQPLTLANAELIGTRLKQLLKEANVPAAPALVVVGRDRVIVKDVRHPPVPPADEPNVIRFAALKEMADGADDVAFDYMPLPSSLNATEKRAAVVFVKKDLLAAVRKMCDAAGLKIAAVTPRPYAAISALATAAASGLVPPPDPADGPVAIVVAHEAGGEFTVCRDGQVAFTRSIPPAAVENEAALLAELRRNLAVASGQAGNDVQAIYVAEAETRVGSWSGRIKSALGLPVYSFDPLANIAAATSIPPEFHGRFLGPIGLLAARGASHSLPINFTVPRQPRRGADDESKRKKMLLAGLAASVLFAALAIGGYLMVDSSETRIRTARQRIAQVEEELKRGEQDAKRLAAVNEFANRDVNWLDEYYEQAIRFPDIKKARFIQFEGTAEPMPTDKERAAELAKGPPLKNAPPKKAARLTMTVAADNSALPAEFKSALVADSRFYVGTDMKTGPLIGGGKSSVQQFILTTGVAHRTPAEYTRKLYASFPKAPEPPKIADAVKKDTPPPPAEPLEPPLGDIDE